MTQRPDSTVYVEPGASRSILEWTPALIKAARVQADAGHLELAADFWESAMADDRVQAALSTRTKGLIALPLSFEAVRGSKRLVKALEAGEDFYVAFPSAELGQLLAWGLGLGVGAAQLVWTDRGAAVNRLVPILKVWHPRNLRRDTQRRVWQARVEGGQWRDIDAGDGKWILYTPYGESRPWAWGVWRAIALWHLLKQYAIQDWGDYSAKNAGGHVVATTPEQFSKEKRKEVAQDLFALQANSAIALPAGVTLELLESDANTYQTFVAQKDAADMGMAVAILGQNLSTEVSGPVATGATLHGRVLQVFIDADAETLSTCLHDQALTWWAEFNFGARELAPWPKWDTTPPEDKKARVEVLRTVAEALNTLSSANAPVDVRALLEQFGVPMKDPKDIEQLGQVYKYHLDYGALTLNEIRERLGLPPVKGGDEAPKPLAAPSGDAAAQGGDKALSVDDVVRLRSGRTIRAQGGFVQGQLYADAVADAARDRAAQVLDEDVVAVLEAIEGGDSYDAIRARLVKTYRGMSPDKLARLTEAAFTMAELGGRHAINEDL